MKHDGSLINLSWHFINNVEFGHDFNRMFGTNFAKLFIPVPGFWSFILHIKVLKDLYLFYFTPQILIKGKKLWNIL